MPSLFRNGCISLITFLVLSSIAVAVDIDFHLSEARQKGYAKEYEQSLAHYDVILKAEPDNIEALTGKARVLSWTGEYGPATGLYRKVLTIEPANKEASLGLADTYAWQKNYTKALAILQQQINDEPMDREILLRLAKYHLWAKNKKKALHYSKIVLRYNPADTDAARIRQQADTIYFYEYFMGYNFLHINNTRDGSNVYTGLKYEPDANYSLYGRFDYLDRFGDTDLRATAGGSLKLNKHFDLSAELSLSPDSDIYPRIAGWVELANPVFPALVIYGSVYLADYKSADLLSLTLAGEYYVTGNVAFLMRYTISKTSFDSGGDSTDDSVMVKATGFFSSDNEVFVYFADGNEPFKINTIDSIGGVNSMTYGIGGTYFFTPTIGISPRFEFQDRSKGVKYYQYLLEIKYRI